MTLTKDQIIISDLFKGEYDHNKRLAEQQILYQRLMQHQDDPVVVEIAKTLKDLTENRIASIIHYDSIIDKLKKHNITVI